MDKEILKLLPQKAFKLLSIKESLKIGERITKSRLDREFYDTLILAREQAWLFPSIKIVKILPTTKKSFFTKDDGENILKIYFSQFFEKNNYVHIDLRDSSFSSNDYLYWSPSRFYYQFSGSFREGVCALYKGFYFKDSKEFEKGLSLLNITSINMPESKKNEIQNIFLNHFGEGQSLPVKFSLKKLQDSFNNIFSYFLKEDIPLNPEFAVLGINLVTLYMNLQKIPHELNVSEAFFEVAKKY